MSSVATTGAGPPRIIRTISMLVAATALAATAMTVATLLAWHHFGPAADLYRKVATDPPDEVEGAIAAVLSPLAVGLTTTLATAVLFGWMAYALRRPRRRWPQTTTVAGAVVLGFLLMAELLGGMADDGTAPDDSVGSPRQLLGYDLAPDWYSIVNAILGLVTLILVVAGAIVATRSTATDYYRKESWQPDDRWLSFVAKQKDNQANGT